MMPLLKLDPALAGEQRLLPLREAYERKRILAQRLSGAERKRTTIGRCGMRSCAAPARPRLFRYGTELRRSSGRPGLSRGPDRRNNAAMRNGRLCALLSRQGLTVVCCTISMFDAVRDWNRANIPGYFEVYVKAAMETLRRRDQKGLYSGGTEVAGVHFSVEEPKTPDLILENDGQTTPAEQVQRLRTTFLEE